MSGSVVAARPPPTIRLSRRMVGMTTSVIREILKVTERPEVLSFAGGLPAPELFPIEALSRAHTEVLATDGEAACQYSASEGFVPLRAWIAARLRLRGIDAHADNVLITSGAQQGLDLVAKVLLDAGDEVALEDPSYLAALQTFRGYEAKFLVVTSDAEGMDVSALAAQLKTRRPKFIYVVPNFNNPKGTTLSLERRLQLVELAARHGVPILEDDPYGELRFRGAFLPPLAALDGAGMVINLGTFSKTLAPGLRIGWIHGPAGLMRSLTIGKQATDLHTNSLAQRATAKLLETFDYEGHLTRLREVYGSRAEAMKRALEAHLPPGTTRTDPEGGLFLWARLPGGLRTDALLELAVKERVAFVPGAPFYAGRPQHDFLRLNFSNRGEALIDEGMRRLGRVVAQELAQRSG